MQTDVLVEEVLEMVKARKLKFPSPPRILTKLNSVINDTSSSIADVVRVAQTHPVLSARLLQVANSAALNMGTPITHLNEAIQRLGNSFVRNLALSLTLQEQFRPTNVLAEQVAKDLWSQSVDTAAMCSILVKYLTEVEEVKLDASVALSIGIIHKIGELPLVEFAMVKGYKPHEVINLDPELKQRLSYEVLKGWGLPDVMVSALAYKGRYGPILHYAQSFLSGAVHEIENSINLGFDQFRAYVQQNDQTVIDLKSAFKD